MTQIFTSIPLEEFKTVLSETVKQEVEKFNRPQPEKPTEFITRKETARILGVSLPTLNDWTKRGLFPCYRIASRVRYKKEEINSSLQLVKSLKYGRS